MIHRRKFLQLSGTAIAAATTFNLMGSSLADKNRNWGVQLFSIPQMVASDFKGTLKKLGELGYRELEFFGPYPFSAQSTIDRWVGLAKQLGITQNAFYGYPIGDVKKMLQDNNLSTPSVHMDIITMRTNMTAAMKELSALGTRHCVIPALMEEPKDTADDYKRFADEFNTFGKQMSDYGITFVYHNHGYEHAPKDRLIPMDILLQNTDPDKVKFELDIFWMQAAGASPIDYLKKYPNRFKLMHVKDASEQVRFSGDGGTPDQWMPLFPKMADPGSGVFDIKGIIKTAVESGTEHFFLERDLTPTPDATLKNSIQYFSALKV
jgi:sugar phosphate isomerase/epimerase